MDFEACGAMRGSQGIKGDVWISTTHGLRHAARCADIEACRCVDFRACWIGYLPPHASLGQEIGLGSIYARGRRIEGGGGILGG